MRNYPRFRSRILLVAATLAAFALRMYHLGQQPLSWDEGWSIGLSSLSWDAILHVTSLDVHPPFYYDLLKIWLGLGRNELLVRFLSVAAGVAIVPLAYVTACIWMRSVRADQRGEQVGSWAAGMSALSPFLIYYAQVTRMYALCATFALLATYWLLKAVDTDGGIAYLAFVASTVAALYTFYYTACVIAAAWLYAMWTHPRQRRALLASAIACAVLYAPWLFYAVPPMLARVGSRTGFTFALADVLRFVSDGVFGLVFAYGAGWLAVYAVLCLLLFTFVLAVLRREPVRGLLLPGLTIVLTLAAVSLGAKAHMFAARYLIPASPFLALWIAWALDTCWRRAKWLGTLALAIILLVVTPTLTCYVYAKAYEVSGAFDPQADYHYLQTKTAPDDMVFFNVLSLAGLYERFRGPSDPAWSYVQRWDPVVEPLEAALEERVRPAVEQHRCLWFVLYKGTVAANLALKEWLDANLFPAYGQWREDTLYVQYLSPTANMTTVEPLVTFGEVIRLLTAEFTPQAHADDRVTVRLTWTAMQPIPANLKVFVHLYAADGRLIAQHDAVPVNELRPTASWLPNESIIDNHGLWLPADSPGSLRLVVGLYSPESNTRLMLSDGMDHAEIGMVEVLPKAR